jgi:hypothetical protein
MLMVKMTEDWRRALDNRQVVGVLFIDLKKAFDSVSHPILLNKLHGLGISGDIWSWIMDYLSNRTQITVVNGCHSKQMEVKFGVPQGSRYLAPFYSPYSVMTCLKFSARIKIQNWKCMQTIQPYMLSDQL